MTTNGLPTGADDAEQRAMWDALTDDEKLGASVTLALQALRVERDLAAATAADAEVERYAALAFLRHVLEIIDRAGWQPTWAEDTYMLTRAREYADAENPPDPAPADNEGGVSER